MKVNQGPNAYPKVVHPQSAKASYVSPDLNLGKMRDQAQKNNQDHSNLPNGELNAIDKKVGPVKGGC